MKSGPNISLVASLVGDPGRANMLVALVGGRALTASELAQEAGVTLQTASSHLSKLTAGGLIEQDKQGRHRYFKLSGPDVAHMLETLMGLAERAGHARVRTGPKDPQLRRARVCYDHLAGDMGVAMFDALESKRLIARESGNISLTNRGEQFLLNLGIDVAQLRQAKRPLCKSCLDWSVRRNHLAGAVGAALLDHFYEKRWARREPRSRVVTFTRAGEMNFRKQFSIAPPLAGGE
jgi:DNA-binding transcriptional ArsR family regulator